MAIKNPTHLAYVATLPCETRMSAKQAINDKLQGSVATYLIRYDTRCYFNVRSKADMSQLHLPHGNYN